MMKWVTLAVLVLQLRVWTQALPFSDEYRAFI